MFMKNFILFSIPALIWGSTWLAIKYQLGIVDPLVSVFYRFLIAAIILFAYCGSLGINLKYSAKQHFFMALQGLLLFGINYWLVYLAEVHLKSGLVAVLFSTIIFLNIFNGALFLKSKVRLNVLFNSLLGFIGIALVFKEELFGFTFSSGESLALILAGISVITASFGNITSAYNQKNKLPVIQTNAFGMLYGSLLMLLLALATGKSFTFDFSLPYIGSLMYLAIFGSVIAFTSYLTLLGKIGADKSAYVTLVFPIIALVLSTIFEDYNWNALALLGVILITIGNFMTLRKKRVNANA
ncbi:MAG: EamA family transporter [Ignavibacteria bacterium]|nr:EamA family transporter [Ignavibacteria bacterium]MBT8381453.1 EamA family transporter [Ignavibacteria bacterium]MBT8391930.1 EamA family transporter [Ignavibacteria bacterium]NNJ52207.1 EamA family transporter [Ignavibacteriaceae bacterium]NNL21750.1 EamA family transporter [Ignavibacteriaceae bacterium]